MAVYTLFVVIKFFFAVFRRFIYTRKGKCHNSSGVTPFPMGDTQVVSSPSFALLMTATSSCF